MEPPALTCVNLQNSQLNSSRDVYFNITNRQELSGNADPYSILENWVVLDALFDSDARYDPPKCHPDTRIAVLSHIREWACNPESLPVMWIRGGVGAGKSAIAQTLSEGWDEDGILAASFYFSRTAPGRNEKKYVITTLAYQIAISIPSTRPLIEDVIRRMPMIFERNLRAQMKKLIVDPLLSAAKTESIDPKTVVVDGLDECCIHYPTQNSEEQQKEILESIYSALEHKGLPLRFLIASRPERQIREIFDYGLLESISSRTTLDHTHSPAADIELYLRCKLAQLSRAHPHLGPSWPSGSVISRLVTKASGHFIYAAVVVRHLSSPRMDPEAGLKAILGLELRPNTGEPFAELDVLYSHIMESVAVDSLPVVMDILTLITGSDIFQGLFSTTIVHMSPCFVAKYLSMSLGQLYIHLIDLHSILDIPSEHASRDAPIKFLHASFGEYLTQPHRSKQFCINQPDWHPLGRFLPLLIRHLFTQVLSSDDGWGDEYDMCGFASLTNFVLKHVEPHQETLIALRALVSQDESEFIHYIHQANLAHLGTARRSMGVIKFLYYGNELSIPRRPYLLDVLKKTPVQDFVPIDPAEFEPTMYKDALSWFCDTYQVVALRQIVAVGLQAGSPLSWGR